MLAIASAISVILSSLRWRTHLSLEMDTPERRPVQRIGSIFAVEELGGLRHHYERRAA